ncbi:tyrosine-protein phosphatase [Kutzneria albida]|uniref:Tyrosine specific protein phosphatases domain-containing protein n=1 Tax=Kutzneria albida DSM 43870 TaxID=1449976 RepID=W5WJM1_9PSEU|nr:tyrosine-protein phosphatase [Kutzneria albida]AHH98364.1 hypothetical protein KALB_5002 [Kutzneria albida DSM 43870]
MLIKTVTALLALTLTAAPAPAGAAPKEIPFTAATATQRDAGSFALSWSAPGVRQVTVYAGRTQDGIDYGHPVGRGEGTSAITVSGLGAADRWWFRLVPDHGAGLTVADRDLHLASAPNFRDAGGYRTADGHWVRMGAVYRSSDLSALSEADLAKLRRLGIRTVDDLRSPAEREQAPDRVPAGATAHTYDVVGTGGPDTDPQTPEQAEQLMMDTEVHLVRAASAQAGYHSVLAGIADRRTHNVLYHCTAGKDRTGWTSAVLLTALGVPRETVYADYLASNTYRAAANEAVLSQLPEDVREIVRPILEVRAKYLDSGFAEVAKEFGGFDRYLSAGLHVDPAALRAALLV